MCQAVVRHRRTLHTIPELGFALPKTIAYIKEVLTPLGCTLTAPIDGSICAYFDGQKPTTIAFRADMDALPLTESDACPYGSTHPGAMHACGHDGHMAIALTLADYVAKHLANLPHNILLIFQPAEETSGGAKPLCDTGLLAQYQVMRLFGLHLWPNAPVGRIVSCPGPMMAQSNEVDVTITGKSVHLSRSEQGKDALAAGMELLSDTYAMVDSLDPAIPRKLRFGKMESGSVRNAVSGHTRLEGSLRTYDQTTFNACTQGLRQAAQAVEASTGCTVEVVVKPGYPPVWNDGDLYAQLEDFLGHDAPLRLEQPALASEDFSFYQQVVPALFFFLGTGQTPELHAVNFDFDDQAILQNGVDFFTKLLYWS